jgi:hypothetical protein
MERPNYRILPITDSKTYLKWDKNRVVVDYEKYAKDLDDYIDYLEMKARDDSAVILTKI